MVTATGVNPFHAYTTVYLMGLLVQNPTSGSFALGINGNAIAQNDASQPFADVTRQQILNEIQNRIATHKNSNIAFTNDIVDNASQIGAVAPQVGVSNSIQISPAFQPPGPPPNPVQQLGAVV